MVELDLDPDERTLRGFGVVAFVVLSGLGLCAWWQVWPFPFALGAARAAVAIGLGALAVASGVLALIAPRANRPLYVVLALLGYPIGVVVSNAVLAALFFAIFTPLGLVMRLSGKDPLQRALERDRTSYWAPARVRRPKPSYFRQF